MATTQQILIEAAKQAADYLSELNSGNRRFGSMYQDITVARDLQAALDDVAGATNLPISEAMDPAEHAAHALIDALTTFEQQVVLATMLPDSAKSLERLDVLRNLTKRAEQHATLVNGKCAAAIDTLLERRR